MPKVTYGNGVIDYTILEKDGLKSHYIVVEKSAGVILKGKSVPLYKADQLILKKARWILSKLNLVKRTDEEEIVTGSRIMYLGRRYYTEIVFDNSVTDANIEFNHSQFKFTVNPFVDIQAVIKVSLQNFYRAKAVEKITPRIKKWSKTTGLPYNELKFLKLTKRWGSCTDTNNIIINIDTVKLPFSLIDYVLVHELVHTKIKNHSKEYWAEVSKHIGNWKELDEKIFSFHI
ncbi:M48 family metallopeptidase [Mucilaginibacter pallidiroseus]|uniref:M48 family metallopeptidase n=1 Tax=Mucilaginibacter pallidiroseus TaxID=2599295 RepID=A0A563UGP8_9SPHI|nr:SprT family zinc-dependent metalloprotease [Mucilaginibacter pallidiroseus]TWR30469.1 M48 family metallopeptidase [Mucilaginibacter pallidiroseus]